MQLILLINIHILFHNESVITILITTIKYIYLNSATTGEHFITKHY